MRFEVIFYRTATGVEPVGEFLEQLRQTQPVLEKLVSSGLAKLVDSQRHGPPLTLLVDPQQKIYELRVGRTNIARVFFCFQPGQKIFALCGYVKRQQKLDSGELERARAYKRDLEGTRHE